MLTLFLSVALPAISVASRQYGEPEAPQMQLLQHKFILEGAEEWHLKEARPLTWIHFPKCGSSFINAITRLPGACPSMADHALNEDTVGGGACWLSHWFKEHCPRDCQAAQYVCQQSALPHVPLTNYAAQRGHLVGMFRDPDQRILSGYHDDANNFAAEDYGSYLVDMSRHKIQESKANCTGSMVRGLPKIPLSEFAETWKGGMTYQLVADQETTTALDPRRLRVTRRDATEAARRVREDFAFVGLTEEWDLSICLFHKIFGGSCHAFEFEDTRPSFAGKSADKDYDTSQLEGWHDDIDEVVYAAALEVFRRNLVLFNVSQETCQECSSQRESAPAFWQERRETGQ